MRRLDEEAVASALEPTGICMMQQGLSVPEALAVMLTMVAGFERILQTSPEEISAARACASRLAAKANERFNQIEAQ